VNESDVKKLPGNVKPLRYTIDLAPDLEAFTFARVPAGADIPPPPEDRLQVALAASAGNLVSTGPETEVDPTDAPPEE